MDDDFELNFAAPSTGSAKHNAIPKRGRWTDRAAAKQEARRTMKSQAKFQPPIEHTLPPTRSSQTTTQVQRIPARNTEYTPSEGRTQQNGDSGGARISRPAQRDDKAKSQSDAVAEALTMAKAILNSSNQAGPSRIPAGQSSSQSASASRGGKLPQVISSLFTSNPVHQAPKQSGPSAPGLPSNAPLRDDTNTFAGLGLDPLLTHHLTKKMGLKAPTGIQRSSLPYMLSTPLDVTAKAPLDESDDEDYEDGGSDSGSNVKGKGKASGVDNEDLHDVFIQSQTGSGKTLAYLLPIIQTLLPLSQLSYIDRSVGTLAIILAPTRELAQQIERVLEQLLSMALSLPDQEYDTQYTRWLVSGLLTGGATKTHEKARLRKGVPILVATPGRLLDHLQNTSSFQCGKTMFLVLDEADRLMDLGFEETIQGIIKALEGRRKLAISAEDELDRVGGGTMRWPFWSRGRRNILCSATIDAKVEKLAGMALKDPLVFRAEREVNTDDAKSKPTRITKALDMTTDIPAASDKFTPPAQLSQKYVVVPTKLRLVALVALLRSIVASPSNVSGNKVIVFLSSTDTVDYHWRLLGGVKMDEASAEDIKSDTITLTSPLLPKTSIQRLHGSLPLAIRKASLAKFAEKSESPAILLATSVASRGLDLPLVRSVIQYDLPTEGGANEYVHRVGRTARAGKGGEAWAFVGFGETGWVKWIEGKMSAGAVEEKDGAVKLTEVGVNDILRKGFGGKGYEYEGRATEAQLAFERWVLSGDEHIQLARRAFASFMRAYSTHPTEEKAFFHPKSLHLGHLAKSFALRETPSVLGRGTKPAKNDKESAKPGMKRKRKDENVTQGEEINAGSSDDEVAERGPRQGKEATARNKTEERMYEAVRKAGRAIKSGGALGEFRGANGGAGSEYQVLGGQDIEKMVSRR